MWYLCLWPWSALIDLDCMLTHLLVAIHVSRDHHEQTCLIHTASPPLSQLHPRERRGEERGQRERRERRESRLRPHHLPTAVHPKLNQFNQFNQSRRMPCHAIMAHLLHSEQIGARGIYSLWRLLLLTRYMTYSYGGRGFRGERRALEFSALLLSSIRAYEPFPELHTPCRCMLCLSYPSLRSRLPMRRRRPC